MTTIHVEQVSDRAILPRDELQRLLELARRSEPIEMDVEKEVSTIDMMRLADKGGAFDFWLDEGEDIYHAQDGEEVLLPEVTEWQPY